MNKIIKNILKNSILYPAVMIKRAYEANLAKNNPQKLISIRYKKETGQALNIVNPKTLQDKINFLSFHSNTDVWSKLTDKVEVREYVTQCGFNNILNEVYGVYDSPNEIDYSILPDSFVLKTNHASATNILVKDKKKFNTEKANNILTSWLKKDYGFATAQPHYSRIKPKIIAEKYLIDKNDPNKLLPDFKFFCLNGIPESVFVLTDREPNTHNVRRMFYDMDWHPHEEWLQEGRPIASILAKPATFDKMVEIAKILSRPFPFVRVDFYDVDGKIVFGEMTFTPGHDEASPLFLEKFGAKLDISEYFKE